MSPRDQVRVMKRDAYGRLDVNSYPLVHRISPVEPETPWAVNLADDQFLYWLLCFDFDGKTKQGVVDDELMERAADQCDALSAALTQLGIAHVVCQSSGTGGRHIWIALRHGASKDEVGRVSGPASAVYGQLDFGMLNNPVTGSARPPGSPHRDGSYSTVLSGNVADLVTPSTTSADLSALAELLEQRRPALPAQESRPSGPVNIRHRAHRELSPAGAAHMATVGGGNDPSWTGFMCLLSAANAGWSLGDIQHAVKTAPGLEHYRTRKAGSGKRRPRDAGEARARLARQWKEAEKRVALQRPLAALKTPDDLTELDSIVRSVTDLLERFRISPGRWGTSEAASNQQSILRALAYLTLHTGKQTVAASIRTLGSLAGLGRTTAATALPVLENAGYIERVTSSDDGNAAEWRLAPRFSTASGTVRSHPFPTARPPAAATPILTRSVAELFAARAALVTELEEQLLDQRHDLFSRLGLGHLAGKLYALLKQHASLTVETAARLLGVTTRHTATILSRLRQHRLVLPHRDGWARAKRDLRDQAAIVLGVAGTLNARAERYRVEREVWAWWLFEVAVMNSSPRSRPRRPHVSSRPLFAAPRPGERVWPRYPRSSLNQAQHRIARELVAAGLLNPENRWQYLGDAA